MGYNLTLIETKLETVSETGGLTQAQWIDAAIANSVNRIGEFKRMYLKFNTDVTNIASTNIYINPGNYLPKSAVNPIIGAGSTFWVCQTAPSPIGTYICNYQSSLSTPLTGKIQAVRVVVVSVTQFIVEIDWIETADNQGFTNPPNYDNHSRLLKDTFINPNELSPSGSSVYSDTNIDFRTYIYLEKAGAPGLFGSIDVNPQFGYKSGFYNLGTHGVAPYFTTPQFILKINGASGSSISSLQDTVGEFRCDSPVVPSSLLLRIIRSDKFDDSVQFQANYDMDSKWIDVTESNSTRIIGPFSGPTLVAGSTYKWNFKIDKNSVVNGQKYRLIAIVRYNNFPTNYEVTSFISDELDVNPDVPFDGTGLTFSSRVGDIKTLYAGADLTSTIEERMTSRCTFDFPANQWKNDILARLGLTTSNDPRRYLTEIEFTIYQTYTDSFGVWKQVYDYRFTSKIGPISYQPKSGIFIDDSVSDRLVFSANWRNRYESNVVNISTTLNGSPYILGANSTQYWGNKQMYIDWRFKFYYDDYVTPFTDYIVYTQKFFVKDYVADTVLKIVAQNPPFDSKEFWCAGEEMCLQGEIVDVGTINPADIYRSIVNIDPLPGSIGTIEESELFLAPILGATTTPKIYNQDVDYDSISGIALFCVDEELLIIGQGYKVSVIAKKS